MLAPFAQDKRRRDTFVTPSALRDQPAAAAAAAATASGPRVKSPHPPKNSLQPLVNSTRLPWPRREAWAASTLGPLPAGPSATPSAGRAC
eukprot:597598-Prorocentrum_minimum.AAC.1